MHVVSANTGLWINGTNTAIRIEFDDDAKHEAEIWSGPQEKMLDRCAWRLIHNRWDEVQGEAVCFKVNRDEMLRLIEELRKVDGAPS